MPSSKTFRDAPCATVSASFRSGAIARKAGDCWPPSFPGAPRESRPSKAGREPEPEDGLPHGGHHLWLFADRTREGEAHVRITRSLAIHERGHVPRDVPAAREEHGHDEHAPCAKANDLGR